MRNLSFGSPPQLDDALTQRSEEVDLHLTPLTPAVRTGPPLRYLSVRWNPSTHDFELDLPVFKINLDGPSDWRKALEYAGFLVGKWVPKTMSLRRGLRTLLPLLFGLEFDEHKLIVIRLAKAIDFDPHEFHNLLGYPTNEQLLAAGGLPNMSKSRKERWKDRVSRNIARQNAVCFLQQNSF